MEKRFTKMPIFAECSYEPLLPVFFLSCLVSYLKKNKIKTSSNNFLHHSLFYRCFRSLFSRSKLSSTDAASNHLTKYLAKMLLHLVHSKCTIRSTIDLMNKSKSKRITQKFKSLFTSAPYEKMINNITLEQIYHRRKV